MTRLTITPDRLAGALALVLSAGGCDAAIADEVGRALAENDRCGHGTHGARQIDFYIERLKAGRVDGTARPEVASDAGSIIRIAGNRAFGQVAGEFAARLGTERALRDGVALVCLTGSGHLGRNGRWAEIAAQSHVGSLHFGQGIGKPGPVAPTGGREGRLNTTPMAFGLPGADDDPIILDAAASAVSGSRIKQAHDRGEPLDEACLVLSDGTLTADPAAFLRGKAAVLPFGGFKGFGIALFAEIASSIIATGGDAPEHTNSLFSIYFAIPRLMDAETYRHRFAAFRQRIVTTPPMQGVQGVTLPGDRARAARRAGTTLALDGDVVRHIRRAAALAGATAELAATYPEFGEGGR